MLKKIIELSVKNKFLIILFTVLVSGWGIYIMVHTPLDAIPDLSDVQVIIYTEYPGQAPQVVEDQVTYPLTTAMLSVPYSKTVRGYSFFGFSFVYVIFEDGTDLYWARSRVLEYLNFVSGRLPAGVTPSLGPDATGVGWVYEYALESKNRDLSQLRSIQDWYLRYELTSVPGVSEVAGIGGFVKQYQVIVDPNKLLAYDIPLNKVKMAIQRSNMDVGGRVIEMAETEFMVRGLGYIKSVEDIENIPVGVDRYGTPVLLRNIGRVQIGPELRRGLAELNGEGEVVGGIIVMRYGENALQVINNVKKKLEELKVGLPADVKITTVYDRSALIYRAIAFLREKLIEESIIVALVCIVFLLHFQSAFVAIFTLPVGILVAFIIMFYQGINANIMSLGGIAIAIGAMVDAAIVMIENMHKHIEREGDTKDRLQLVVDASKEVGPALFYSLLIITLSFLPIFTLQAQEGRLFKPLAFTKTYAMAAAAFLSITVVPVLMGLFVRGKVLPEERNPINKFLIRIYRPVIQFVLRFKISTILVALTILVATLYPLRKLGSEFMPPLYEGDFLYMPTTLPGISITKARELLQQTDKIIKTFPETHHVFGKIGRAETATDPAPLSMIETTIMLKPEEEWAKEKKDRWYSNYRIPGFLKKALSWVWPEDISRTPEKLTQALDQAIKFPGLTNAWTMPIKTRVDMLSTGIKTPVGIKVAGPKLEVLQDLGKKIEAIVRIIPGTLSVYAERVVGGNYVDFTIRRREAARYGLTVMDVQEVIMSAIGGMNITKTVEGLERYPVNLRYERELRGDIESLKRVLVPTPRGEHIPLDQLADIDIKKGPPSIKSENSRLNAWIYVDIKDIDVGTYVSNAKKIVEKSITFPPGYNIKWSGQYEYMERAKARLKMVIPLTLVIIFLLLYLNFKNITECLIVMLSLPFSIVGGIWIMYLLHYHFSVAVGVGFIALAGVAAETGVVMLIYLDQAYAEIKRRKGTLTIPDLYEAIIIGAVERVRPKMMTVAAIMGGLLPILWGHGTGAQVMKRIAAPMVGGMISSTILTLIVIPVIYALVKGWEIKRQARDNQIKV